MNVLEKNVKLGSFISQFFKLLILGNSLFLYKKFLYSSVLFYVFDILGAYAVKFLDTGAYIIACWRFKSWGRFSSILQMEFLFCFIYFDMVSKHSFKLRSSYLWIEVNRRFSLCCIVFHHNFENAYCQKTKKGSHIVFEYLSTFHLPAFQVHTVILQVPALWLVMDSI